MGVKPSGEAFNAKYKKRYGVDPTVPNPVFGYDAAWLLALAVRKAGTDPNKIRQAVPTAAASYGAATGKIIFDADGQRTSAPLVKLKMTRDGKFVPTQ